MLVLLSLFSPFSVPCATVKLSFFSTHTHTDPTNERMPSRTHPPGTFSSSARAASAFVLFPSATPPPDTNSSNAQCAVSRANMMSSSQTEPKWRSRASTRAWMSSRVASSFYGEMERESARLRIRLERNVMRDAGSVPPFLLLTSSSSTPTKKKRDAYRRYTILWPRCSMKEH